MSTDFDSQANSQCSAAEGDHSYLRTIIARHLHPEFGTPYWWRRQDELGFDICDRIRCRQDLVLLGATHPADLCRGSVWDLLPRSQLRHRERCIVSETGGTSGVPVPSVYGDEDFVAAFVEPFLVAASSAGFPLGLQWLWIGPSGPHVIGKAVRRIAMATGSPDPWSVDFDPRWAKKIKGSEFAARRYLAHVVDQATAVFHREHPEVLFTTPPVLAELASRLDCSDRSQIRGVHYGGMALTAEQINSFRNLFPNAVHLSGYGNSLCGVAMEVEVGRRSSVDYYTRGSRLIYDVVCSPEDMRTVAPGERGRVMFHRIDTSVFLPNVIERDEAELLVPNRALAEQGWESGLRNPGPPNNETELKTGLY